MLYNRIVEGKIRESLWPDVIHHEKKYQVVPSAKFAIVPKPAKVDEKDYDGLYTEDVESAPSLSCWNPKVQSARSQTHGFSLAPPER